MLGILGQHEIKRRLLATAEGQVVLLLLTTNLDSMATAALTTHTIKAQSDSCVRESEEVERCGCRLLCNLALDMGLVVRYPGGLPLSDNAEDRNTKPRDV